MFTKRFDVRKLVTHEQPRTRCDYLGVKWSQVQILSARQKKWALSWSDATSAASMFTPSTWAIRSLTMIYAAVACNTVSCNS